MDVPYWNPISFYVHMGYERVDQSGEVVLAWKRLRGDAGPPLSNAELRQGLTERIRLTGDYEEGEAVMRLPL